MAIKEPSNYYLLANLKNSNSNQGKGVPPGESKDQRLGVRGKHVGVWGILPSLAGPDLRLGRLRAQSGMFPGGLGGRSCQGQFYHLTVIFLFLTLLPNTPPPTFIEISEKEFLSVHQPASILPQQTMGAPLQGNPRGDQTPDAAPPPGTNTSTKHQLIQTPVF